MRRVSTITSLSLCALLFASVSLAQQTSTVATAATVSVPNLIRYSGTLKDAQGAALPSATTGVTFAIYKQQDGGAPIWIETQNVASDATGNYSVLLGSTTAGGMPADLFSQQEQRWLGVQVEGQAEQPRVLLVSVPYAFKAHEAETFGGKPPSAYMTAPNSEADANGMGNSQANSMQPTDVGGSGTTNYIALWTSSSNLGSSVIYQSSNNIGVGTTSPGYPLTVNGNNTGTVVSVTQAGSGIGVNAYSYSTTGGGTGVRGKSQGDSGIGVRGDALATIGVTYGVYGTTQSPIGVGVSGNSSSTTGASFGVVGTTLSSSGVGVLGSATASSGATTGVSGYVASSSGTAGVFNNAAGGNILIGQNNGVPTFTVNGSGNVNAAGGFTGNGAGLTGIQFSQLVGALQDSQFNGQYDNQINLPNSMNMFTGSFTGTYVGNGSGLMGVLPAAGSPNYVQNNNSQPQTGASFNIDGFGTVGQTLSANVITTATTYQILGQNSVLSIGNNPSNDNLFLGIGAGGNYPGSGEQNTFVGTGAGSSTGGSQNTFTGDQAGYSTTFAQGNTFTGASAGMSNTTGINNSYYGVSAGIAGTGANNIAFGAMAGSNNSNGNYNIYLGSPGQNAESNTIRIGASNQQNFAYMAGIFGNSPSGALPVVINANGQLGTSAGSGVTSWNGRTGAVVPQTGDYSFSMISGSLNFSMLSGTLASSQFSGTYSNAVSLSNTSNVYYGNGSNLTGIVPTAGSPYYIQNGTSQQSGASFNIAGSGTAGGTLSGNFVNTANSYQIGGSGVVSIGSLADQNLFLGIGAGANNVAGSGQYNSFSGYQAGYSNTGGVYNTFSGNQAGYANTMGTYNTFSGYQAGYSSTTSSYNTFSGYQAGYTSSTGGFSVFSGYQAGYSNTTGMGNTFVGFLAGSSNTTGSSNAFFGDEAGTTNTTGSNDIYIANRGSAFGNESNAIRIGTAGVQTTAYIAGIFGSTVMGDGLPVYVDGNGLLGTVVSSRRFKEQIEDMGDSTSPLMKLRPVTFLYRPEYSRGHRTLQFGLIAEEVAEVYPELVAYDKDGQPYTVRYQYLAPMLLNEVQKQYRRAEQQSEIVTAQQAQIIAQQHEIEGLRQQLQLQNATLQERLSKLESYVATQTQMQAASDVQRTATAGTSGDSQ